MTRSPLLTADNVFEHTPRLTLHKDPTVPKHSRDSSPWPAPNRRLSDALVGRRRTHAAWRERARSTAIDAVLARQIARPVVTRTPIRGAVPHARAQMPIAASALHPAGLPGSDMAGFAARPDPHRAVDIEGRAAVGSQAEMATPPACTTHRRSVASPCRMLLFILPRSVDWFGHRLGRWPDGGYYGTCSAFCTRRREGTGVPDGPWWCCWRGRDASLHVL
jgi:hypothetical protein